MLFNDFGFPEFFVVALVGLLIAACFGSCHEDDRLMKVCLADGHKEYECIHFIRGGRR